MNMLTRWVSVVAALAVAGIVLFGIGCQARELSTPVAEAETKPTPDPRMAPSIDIAAVGDIMMGSTSINNSFLPPNDGRDMLKDVTPILSAADIAFGNLEGPMLEGGKSEKCADSAPAKSTNDAYAAPTP